MHLHEQVAAAFEVTNWTIEELLDKSGLDMDRTQLGRKLSGKAPMRTEEAQVLVDTIRRKGGVDVVIQWPLKRTKKAA